MAAKKIAWFLTVLTLGNLDFGFLSQALGIDGMIALTCLVLLYVGFRRAWEFVRLCCITICAATAFVYMGWRAVNFTFIATVAPPVRGLIGVGETVVCAGIAVGLGVFAFKLAPNN